MDFNVELDANHLKRMASVNPREGLKEILWNSCDADATEIRVSFETSNELDVEKIDRIMISDNGHGLSLEKAQEALGKYGSSEKTHKDKTPLGRRLHGRLGEGRYKALSIGSSIKWTSVYNDNGIKKKINISFHGQAGTNVQISAAEDTTESCGMTVAISMIDSKVSSSLLKKDESIESILISFAPYLMAHGELKIIYDNQVLDVAAAKQDERSSDIMYIDPDYGTQIKATIKLIRWNECKIKYKYLCTNDGGALLEMPIKESLPISIYTLSDHYENLHKKNLLIAFDYDKAAVFFENEAERMLQAYKHEMRQSGAFEEIKYLKDNDIYPFKEDTTDETERQQMHLFDIFAVKFYETIPRIKDVPKDVKRLTYNLLAETIKTNPSSLKKILEEVFQLSKQQQDDFAKLLEQVSLSNIITTTKEVIDRLLFLDIVHDLVYTKLGTEVKERTQFHKMIERNLWIFGDTYKFGTSDRSLTNVLLEHISELKRFALQPTVPDDAANDMDKIPDLCLWNQQQVAVDLYENLVVELKRPNKVLGNDELQQIVKYANIVSNNSGFNKKNYKWHFILIGKDFDSTIDFTMSDKKDGVYRAGEIDNCKISVFKWSELLAKNKSRYQFYKDKSQFDPTNEMIVKQIDSVFGDLFTSKTK